jgi:TIR domain
MTVFVSHAPADHETAVALEKALDRRGLFVELDNGETAMRPVQAVDVVVALISKDFVFSPWRLRHEQRALDAWAQGKLVLVKLDHAFAPVGLRDLPAIDARRDFTWMKVADAIRAAMKAPAREEADASPAAPQADPRKPPQAARKRRGGLTALFLLVLAVPGIAALAAAIAIWLVNRIGPTPGSLEDLRAGIDQFGIRYGAPSGVTEWAFAAAIAVTVIALVAFAARLAPRRTPRVQPPTPVREEAPAPVGEAVFVSYARVNQGLVWPVVDAAQRLGRSFWLDKKGIGAGDSWAGEIVRAIKGAASVMVMCSKAAFESDHVKREIYLADRYRKRLVPVYVEPAEPPEDFEYFFAGVQSLNLFEKPEAERAQALIGAMGARS